MCTPPTDQAPNVLHNEAAMAILKDAREKLEALGLHCALGPDGPMFFGSEMAASLTVSTSERTIEECIAGTMLLSLYTGSVEGEKCFMEVLGQLRADTTISKAMSAAGELGGSEFAQMLLEGKGLSKYQASYLGNALMECVVDGLKVIRGHDCVLKLEKMITMKAQNNAHGQNPAPVLNVLKTLAFSCTWRVPDDEPVYRLVPEDFQ